MKTILVSICFFLTFTLTAIADSTSLKKPHEFFIQGGSGLSTALYTPTYGERGSGFGGLFGLGYTYYVSSRWGINTGVNVSYYNSTYKADIVHEKYLVPDVQRPADLPPGNWEINADYKHYNEIQSARLLNIPLMVQFLQPIGKENYLYASAGFKIGIPLDSRFTSETDSLFTSYRNIESGDIINLPTQANFTYNGNLNIYVSYMITAEVGIRWPLAKRWGLYAGAYFDYGLNDINNDAGDRMITYNPATGETIYKSALQSSSNNVTVDGSVHLMAIGLRVKMAFR